MATWLTDANGNRCSVEYFGSEAAAQRALDSLKSCRNCNDAALADMKRLAEGAS